MIFPVDLSFYLSIVVCQRLFGASVDVFVLAVIHGPHE
jgi:hypothetical protein